MKVFWTLQAEQDRSEIWEFIVRDNVGAAVRMDELFSAAAKGLVSHPQSGRPGLVLGTRELIPHKNYRLVYEIDGDEVWVLALVHTSRLWPPWHQ